MRTSRNEKNVDILPLTADFARKLNAGRLTSCKSAKDRTSMSVTWEQARLLQKQYATLQASGERFSSRRASPAHALTHMDGCVVSTWRPTW